MGYNSWRPHRLPLISTKNRKKRLQFARANQNWTVWRLEKMLPGLMSLDFCWDIQMVESEFGVDRHDWEHGSIMPYYHCAGWWWWHNGVGDVFLAHFRPLSANEALFKCHALPEHYFWPYPSLYGHHVPILWWLLPAG